MGNLGEPLRRIIVEPIPIQPPRAPEPQVVRPEPLVLPEVPREPVPV